MYLIKITKRKWDRLSDADWLPVGQIQADPLGDLHPTDGELSVWSVDPQSSNLDSIIAAFALTRQDWDNFEYGLFDSSIPQKLGIPILQTDGKTPLTHINGFHRNLAELTADKFTQLVKEIFPGLQKERVMKDEVIQKVRAARNTDQVDESRLNQKIRQRFLTL